MADIHIHTELLGSHLFSELGYKIRIIAVWLSLDAQIVCLTVDSVGTVRKIALPDEDWALDFGNKGIEGSA